MGIYKPNLKTKNTISSLFQPQQSINQTIYTFTPVKMADNNSSTLKSYVDSATGAVQNAMGNPAGSPGDQAQGEAKKQKAEAEHEASHATAKLPGATLSGSGAVAKDSSDRTEGSWNQTAGATKEAIGGPVGSAVSNITGDKQGEAHYDQLHAEGKTRQRG